MTTVTTGTIYGVGVGPGDPDLMSLRADRLIRSARHVAYFRKRGQLGRARTIVEGLLHPDVNEIPMDYPVTIEIPVDDPEYADALSGFYAAVSAQLADLARTGADIVVLCEGDPFFYGSFMHLHARLKDHVPVVTVPAITGMSAAWTATDVPITWGEDVLTVLTGTMPEAALAQAMAGADALVVMKVGRNLPKVRKALAEAGKLERGWLVEYASMAEQRVVRLIEDETSRAPYFSIVLVHGQGRRP
ncbi:MAG: precorrin-2 C(20)-methyltransferase [Erythrobacter sp.]